MKQNRQILQLAVPNLISNITVPLLGAVDLAMMGRINSLTAMGAISLGAMIFNFLYWALGFLRMGTCGFTAQAYGAKRMDESVLTLFRALTVALGGALLLWIFQTPLLKAALAIASPEADLAQATARYFRLRIWAAPATIGAFAFAGWFIGMQDAKTPMWTAILVNVANIGFNALFVFVYHLGSDGVAIGTVLAQYTGLLLYAVLAGRRIARLSVRFSWQEVLAWNKLKRFLHVNSDIFLRTLLLILVFAFFTAQSSRMGNETLVMNTLLYQFFIFYSYAMDGFAHAAEALCGKFTGSRQQNLKKAVIRRIFLWGAGIATVFMLGYGLFFESILSVFTNDAGILAMSRPYLPWTLLITLIGFPAFLYDGVYAGSLATKAMLLTMLSATIGFFALFYGFYAPMRNHALWLAMSGFLALRGISMSLWWKRVG